MLYYLKQEYNFNYNYLSLLDETCEIWIFYTSFGKKKRKNNFNLFFQG
jgi:hypothetical protein